MRFVDEASIRVVGGNGGHGALSFLREKYRPKGGPDGGDGGDGGSVYLVADASINTLSDFRYTRLYRARSGDGGAGRNRSGKSAEDLIISAPLGTIARAVEADEIIGEVTTAGARLLVARGGRGGCGNTRFKSSTNRTPRKITKGGRGDDRELHLELKVLADVGLLGLPNAGKSTLLSRVSAARPKIAEYPFTTLHPNLGVVDIGNAGFVIADIPGLIPGAAQGAGLGIQFLKHLARNHILLHLVDTATGTPTELVQAIRATEYELASYDTAHSAGLLQKERWLILNKMDAHTSAAGKQLAADITAQLNRTQIIHRISAATGAGCAELMQALAKKLRSTKAAS